MRKPKTATVGIIAGSIVILGIIGAVTGGGDKTSSTAATAPLAPVTVTVAAPPSAAPTEAPAPVAPTTEAPAPVKVPMPDVTGMNLQAAQDKIQEAGVFLSHSWDASGAGRMQVLDRDWVVVAQTPSAGELIGEGDATLAVLKIGE